ncbi:MAG: SRPBCC family protein [Bradymonadales bacterium]|nr:SRPBCC family protein [Bradymonadales bacterium]
MWFACTPKELEFFDLASHRLVTDIVLPAPPPVVFRTLNDADAWSMWFHELKVVAWPNYPPRGVGSRREAVLKTLGVPLKIKERFVAWEDGKRFAFIMDALSLPLLSAGGEDYRLEAVGEDRTRLCWHFCYEPRVLTRAVHPLARLFFKQMFQRAAGRLAKYLT